MSAMSGALQSIKDTGTDADLADNFLYAAGLAKKDAAKVLSFTL